MTFIGGIYRKSSPHKSTELFEIDPAWMPGTSQNDGTLWNQSRMRGTLIVLDNHGVLFYFNWKSKNRRRLYLVSREKNTNGKCYKYRFLRAHLTQSRYKCFLKCSLHSSCHSEIQNGHHQGYLLEIWNMETYSPWELQNCTLMFIW